ncbi:hypothetical protein B0O99DRAFT_110493 [Bisporella sp. PMI_857]|nr:hypothetical protein B0O99DRAFT_110493 [Bisporella sp. PMI_857]
MRRFLKKIERRHSHTQGTHVDIYGDLRDEYGVLISDKPPLSKRRRGKRKVVTGSSLERLPVEIKVLILQNADISTLKALVHASPLLHQAYRDQRRTILSAALTGTIPPGLFFEARFLFKVTNVLSQHIPERDARRSELLAEYHENRRHASYVGEALDFKDLISMANYQLMIEKIASQYCKEMLSEHPVTGAQLASWKPPRQTELTRLYRALYRFQLYCIFFQEKISTAAPQTRRLSVMALSRLFLSRFEIWEVEELACIGKYILDEYDFILRQHGNQDTADGKKDYQRQRVKSGT